MRTICAVLAAMLVLSLPCGSFAAAAEKANGDEKGETPLVSIVKTGTVTVSKENPPAKAAIEPAPVTTATKEKISINLASRILTLYRGNVRERSYPVGVGKYSTPTPVGYYTVENKEINPTWIDPDDTDVSIPAGGANPLGYRWIGFSGNYGIHGTNRPDTVGHYASNGCVRMRECDVEDLYERVRVGTDVEVYYNRIVIEASPDHTVSYYIYPDGYERQPLTVAAVKQALAGYGVDTFAEDGAVYEKIIASDGNPAYVAKAYDLVVDGKKLSRRALGKDGIVYLPAQVIADAVDTALVWNGSRGMLSTSYGEAPGVVCSDILYVADMYAGDIFPLTGALRNDFVYEMKALEKSE
ncbi:L,D-transpeptidase [Colibacter massiliensis]